MPSGTSRITYTVTATLPDEETAFEYAAWLSSDHADKVRRAGADSAAVVRVLEPGVPVRVECRYIFPNRGALDTYLANHAPALRAEGLARFPAERGVRFERTVGEIRSVHE